MGTGHVSPHPHLCWTWHWSRRIGSHAREPAVEWRGKKRGGSRAAAFWNPTPSGPGPHLNSALLLHLPLGLHVALVAQKQALHPSRGVLGAQRQEESGAVPLTFTAPGLPSLQEGLYLFDAFHPVLDILEGFFIRDVIYEDNALQDGESSPWSLGPHSAPPPRFGFLPLQVTLQILSKLLP